MRHRSSTSRRGSPKNARPVARQAGPCATCTKDCAGCVFAERAAEARADGDHAATKRALAQMARRGCRRLQVTARTKTGLVQRMVTGAAAAALVLSLGLAGCETDTLGKADTFGVDVAEVFEVAILPADALGDGTPEIYAILPPPDDAAENEVPAEVDPPEAVPILPPECTTDADCTQQFYGCVDGTCQQTMFPVMPQCQADTDCAENEVCTNGACEPVAVSVLPGCVADTDCKPQEVCKDGVCEPMISILPACTSDDDCNTPIEACVDGQCEQVMWPVMPECMADTDCAPGEACVNNSCQPAAPVSCALDADCPPGQTCEGECPAEDGSLYCILPVKGTCVPKANPASCTSDADCVPGDVCVGGCPEGMFCILPGPSVCKTECATDTDCEPNETCVGAQTCPPDQMCILPDKTGVCEPQMFAVLPPSPKPVTPPSAPARSASAAWRAYVEGALAWFRPVDDKTGRS